MEHADTMIDVQVDGQAIWVLGATRCAGDRIVLLRAVTASTARRTWHVDQYEAHFFISPRS